jgi:hypothetical protein
MGIFNPSSSITFTSSGFSPFTVSSSLCNNIGYKIAVLAGPIPNNANSLTINKVYLTSATGANTTTASYTLTNPVTLKSGQSATILIPNVACNSANTHYSLSAKIQYSYTASTLGLQTVNTTGTVAGTSITGKPSTLTSYEPITITNSQSSATPSPFQQMINFTSSDNGWTSISTGNFGQNLEFFYYNGTVIPSWLENYTSTNGLWWLKIAAIPSGSSETVYVGFAPTTTNLFNTVNDGEAPQLSSTYAEYDDGANVFNYYQRWGGLSSLPSGWSSNGVSPVYYSDYMDLWATSGGTLGNISYAYSPPYPIILESLATWAQPNPGSNNGNFGLFTQSATSTAIQVMTGWGGGGTTNLGYISSSSSGSMSYSPPSSASILSIQVASSSEAVFSDNYTNFYTASGQTIDSASYIQYETTYASSSTSDVFSIYWTRVRAYPPNGVMPSVSFGSVA